jgi:hypothetical protein
VELSVARREPALRQAGGMTFSITALPTITPVGNIAPGTPRWASRAQGRICGGIYRNLLPRGRQ